ncbi:hypothetical protein Asi02nite_49540 [Asanoa siamensis]|uniref:Uncharacterized protein n=1 Tax=Asanoa siamensis TaxID=926357 RepID=A0ABQ4CVW9_9ACTN|nr:hypothetical protein Asi02nite_49540 [Asanoa siamensis]
MVDDERIRCLFRNQSELLRERYADPARVEGAKRRRAREGGHLRRRPYDQGAEIRRTDDLVHPHHASRRTASGVFIG